MVLVRTKSQVNVSKLNLDEIQINESILKNIMEKEDFIFVN